MKTSIKTLFTTSLIALAISSSTAYANNVQNSKSVDANAIDVNSIKKVYVAGNVEVTLVQSSNSKTLFANNGDEDVVAKIKDNTLYINSKGNANKPAKITVYIGDIYRIHASENAVVNTKGILNLKALQIFTNDNAIVDLNSKTESLYTVVKGTSELKLKGFSISHIAVLDNSSKITLEKFNALKTDLSNPTLNTYAIRY